MHDLGGQRGGTLLHQTFQALVQSGALQRDAHLVPDAVQHFQFVVLEQTLIRAHQIHDSQHAFADPQRHAGVITQAIRIARSGLQPLALHDVGDVIQFPREKAAPAFA